MLTCNLTRLVMVRGIEKPFSYLVTDDYFENKATCIANDQNCILCATDLASRISDLSSLCLSMSYP